MSIRSTALDRTTSAHPGGIRALVAEDNKLSQIAVIRLFKSLGVEAVVVEDGRAAVDAVMAEHFDIVFLDRYMPVMSGLEAARRIRALGGEHACLPIIACTAASTNEEIRACLDSGMNDVLLKPLSRAQLSEIVAKWVETSPVAQLG